MGGTDGWVYPNNWDHKKGCMMQHNETGREPTEPTDAQGWRMTPEQFEAEIARQARSVKFWRDGWHNLDQDNRALTARVAELERMLLAVYYRKDDGLTDEDFAAVIALITAAPRKGADQ